jgi:glycosyltransferase involved in cell wall biosynthesis
MTWELFSALDTASPYPSTQSVDTASPYPATQSIDAVQSTVLSLKMKYALLQAIQYSKDENIDYIIFVIGIYEADWFMNLYNNARLTQVLHKVIVWTPLDYKPSYKVVENICKADMLFTMTNSGMQSIQDATTERPNIYVVPHAVSKCFYKIPRRKAYKYLKPIIKTLNKDDLIILNANNYVERKQIHLTIEAFAAIRADEVTFLPKAKLWLHTNTKNPEFVRMLDYYRKKFNFRDDEIILTMNDAPEEMLNHIYNFCQIGLQTSWGEGWSLTNCEHAITGAIQVVPDFLATGENFRSTGYAYQVGEKEYINEAGHAVTIADIQLDNILPVLTKAIEEVGRGGFAMASPLQTWESIANQIKDLLIISTKSVEHEAP